MNRVGSKPGVSVVWLGQHQDDDHHFNRRYGLGTGALPSFSVSVPPRAAIRTTVKYEYTEKYGVVIVERTFDKLERKYHEVYYDLDGNVVFEKHPDLDDQSAHGKRGKAPGAGSEHPFDAIPRIPPAPAARPPRPSREP
jgi:hypothetical protein